MKNTINNSGKYNKNIYLKVLLNIIFLIVLPLFILLFFNDLLLKIIFVMISYLILLFIYIHNNLNYEKHILNLNKTNHDLSNYIKTSIHIINNYITTNINSKTYDMEYIRLIKKELEDAYNLLTGKNIASEEEINLKDFMMDFYNTFLYIKNNLNKNNIELSLDINITNKNIIINTLQLKSILTNLILNIVKNSKDNFYIRIKLCHITHTNTIGIYKFIIEYPYSNPENLKEYKLMIYTVKDNINKLNGVLDIFNIESSNTSTSNIIITLPIKYNLYNKINNY